MHLKSLTLKGFKSFASATTLTFEPGIIAVVGPNGSGKSNVVDAIAWVLGEQGAKALRGGKMDDVIFAGTADRPPLGRAEVTLTIDNRDGALPIDDAEISITRRMFRDGAGEYEINGRSCRLLDIQELLSDSGIGREMHVIVGQGHLDAVLSARPEDRRAFIEEAAGVLKHRKRKEKALRKLDAMAANLARLTDLTGELRRQLGPLGRQAETARRAAGIQADLRDARLRLLADDIATVQDRISADSEAQRAARHHRGVVERQLAEATGAGEAAAAALAAAAPAARTAQNTHFALSALAERLRGLIPLAAERTRNLATPLPVATGGRDPEELDAEAAAADVEQAHRDEAVAAVRVELADTISRRAAAESDLAAVEAELAAATQSRADRRENLARLAGTVGSARSRLAAADDEIERLSTAIAEATDRAADARRRFEELTVSIGELEGSQAPLDAAHEQAAAAADEATAVVRELEDEVQEASRRRSELTARAEALALGLHRPDGAAALLDRGVAGVLGPVSSLVTISNGAETAIAAALGAAADAVAVADLTAAVAALDTIRANGVGRVGLLVGGAPPTVASPRPAAPAGATWASDLITVPDAIAGAIESILHGVIVVDDAPTAARLVRRDPGLRAATTAGELIGIGWAEGGRAQLQSTLEVQAAVDEAERQLIAATEHMESSSARLDAARAAARECTIRAEGTLADLYESDAAIAAVAEQLAQLGAAVRSAEAETARLISRRESAGQSRGETAAALADLQKRLDAAENVSDDAEVDPVRRDAAAARLADARRIELDARLALRTEEERARAAAGRGDHLRAAAARLRADRVRAERAASVRDAAARRAQRIHDLAVAASSVLDESVESAAAARAAADGARDTAERSVAAARQTLATVQAEWDRITDSVHSTDLARAEQNLRLEQLAATAADEFAMTVDDLVADYGPQVPVPPSAADMAEYLTAKDRGDEVSAPIDMPYDRPSTQRRADRAAREMTALGKINPLALEEFAAMEERHAFLSTQLEDLRRTRTDLTQVIDEVDAKILELFSSAYRDVAAEFQTVFGTLFPGGEGSLSLTDPSDLLTTGVDVAARPPGKKVRRLSLLSGGERSLVAVAMLVAIFRARPSPFYVLDEVEAALDETNLTRLVHLLRQLRDSSQLIVITHQKYTMEAADVLYGVSMRGDGISQVISQRMDRPAPAQRAGDELVGDRG